LQADCRRHFTRQWHVASPLCGLTRQWAGSDNADPAHSSSHGEGGIFPREIMRRRISPFSHCAIALICASVHDWTPCFDPALHSGYFSKRTPWSNRTNWDRDHHSLLDSDEPHDDRPHKRMRAIGDVELLEDGSQVVLGGLGADVKPLRNLPVRRTLSQELQDLEFTMRQ
jgi:hypothetical protein